METRKQNPIEAQVARMVNRASISYSAQYIGQTKRDNWDCDAWRVSFEYPGKPAQTFEFFTGLGLRAEPTARDKLAARPFGLTEKDIQNRTIYGRRYLAELEKLRKPKAPTVASVLHSLILDSGAMGQSFNDWCANCGYSNDSIKALDTYRQCQSIGERLRMLWTTAQLDALRDALQDY